MFLTYCLLEFQNVLQYYIRERERERERESKRGEREREREREKALPSLSMVWSVRRMSLKLGRSLGSVFQHCCISLAKHGGQVLGIVNL